MNLPYDPQTLPRELKDNYIPADEKDRREMLEDIGLKKIEDLFADISSDIRMQNAPDLPPAAEYYALKQELEELAEKNLKLISFNGGGLTAWRMMEIVPHVSSVRELLTSYTPYQPERSQGTLATQWLYQSLLSRLTGMEAINASMYDRATAMFESINCAIRLAKNKKKTVLVFSTLYSNDLDVLNTLCRQTEVILESVPAAETGTIDLESLSGLLAEKNSDLAAVVFPQLSRWGCLEDVNRITDMVHYAGARAIAVIDPMLLGAGGLVPPAEFGEKGADMIVGEGQHLAIPPSFGGPGLGIFGIRYNDNNRSDIRSAAGRFVGNARDIKGRNCKVMILSTREQHIRRERATSNICSNEAFLATLAGAALLQRGDKGIANSISQAASMAGQAYQRLTALDGVAGAFPGTPFFNEFALSIADGTQEITGALHEAGIQVGSSTGPDGSELLMLSFSDIHDEEAVNRLCKVFEQKYNRGNDSLLPDRKKALLRQAGPGLPSFSLAELKTYYKRLGQQNISPDSSCYPLGSCTMKYNPWLNEYTSSLPGFLAPHPDAADKDVQGCLEVIYQNQEYFKKITGMDAVCTQPVAGAQGELCGIKIFQAWHESRGEKRDIILIPRSAHGTNPATATMAGFICGSGKDNETGIVLIEADADGMMDIIQVEALIKKFGSRISGIMITNPNTSGILEKNFKKIADMIHSVGGLVYMDGANMNAIAGWIDLKKMGVDAVHNNTHKTWSIPHGGGGPGDAFVALTAEIAPFMPGMQVEIKDGIYRMVKPEKSCGSFHRHHGNFLNKVRAYTYLRRLGGDGIRQMSAMAVLSSRYLQKRLSDKFIILPCGSDKSLRMHEFILSLDVGLFDRIEAAGTKRADIIGRFGKLFLDFGFHAPTVAFPEVFGLMIEPTESYTKGELDRFADCVLEMHRLITEHPRVLETVPHFTPISRVDEVAANKTPVFSEEISVLPEILENRMALDDIWQLEPAEISKKIIAAHGSY